jgi:TonB family protein
MVSFAFLPHGAGDGAQHSTGRWPRAVMVWAVAGLAAAAVMMLQPSKKAAEGASVEAAVAPLPLPVRNEATGKVAAGRPVSASRPTVGVKRGVPRRGVGTNVSPSIRGIDDRPAVDETAGSSAVTYGPSNGADTEMSSRGVAPSEDREYLERTNTGARTSPLVQIGPTRRIGTYTVSSGVMAANVISAPTPEYPRLAGMFHMEGQVVLQAVVSRNGRVVATHVLRGHRLLRGAAADAVRQWRYRPYLINGQATDVATIVTVNFRRR